MLLILDFLHALLSIPYAVVKALRNDPGINDSAIHNDWENECKGNNEAFNRLLVCAVVIAIVAIWLTLWFHPVINEQ